MSKNTQLASLINYISVDGSGNVILSSGQIIATQNYVATAVSNLVASAPSTLDTLNELATALGNDANFATTVTTSIGTKVPQTRTITINGTTLDLSADRSFTIAGGVTSFNTRTGAITLTSGDVTGALGYTPANGSNYLPLTGGTLASAPASATDNVLTIRNTNAVDNGYAYSVLALDTTVAGTMTDIRLGSSTPVGIRIYASTTPLTVTPTGAGFQMFTNTSASFPGHMYFDSGANNSAAINFRTATSGGSITTRLRIEASGTIKLSMLTSNGFVKTGSSNGSLSIDTTTYLPLAGGTLTGALTGTSATFNNVITVNTNIRGIALNRDAVTNYNGIGYQTAGVQQWFVGMRENLSSNNYIIYNESGTDALTISKSNSNVGIRTSTPYSPLTVTGAGINWGETVTYYPAPNGYITLAFRLEGTDTINGTWAIGKQSTIENGGVQYFQIVKNGLTGGSLHRADALQIFDPANGNSLFGFKVGINNSSPTAPLSIGAFGGGFSSSTPTLIDLGSVYGSNASGKNQKIKLWSNNVSDIYTYGLGVSSALLEITTANDGSIGFYRNGSTPTELGRFTNNGHFLRPLQPAFLAYSTGFTVTAGGWYNISNAITTEEYDTGSNYSGGRFTAPVAGKYLFYFGGWSSISSNGERYAVSFTINGGGYFYITGGNYCITDSPLNGASIVFNLAAGSYVELSAFSAVGGTWGGGGHSVWWGGYLL
jgi:hypothetical protein